MKTKIRMIGTGDSILKTEVTRDNCGVEHLRKSPESLSMYCNNNPEEQAEPFKFFY